MVRKLLLILSLIVATMVAACLCANGQSAGRIWSGKTPPSVKPTSFSASDIWRDTVAGVSYGYRSSWYMRSDQMEGPQGPAGPQGPKGDPGTSVGGANFGTIRYVSTVEEINAAYEGIVSGSVRSIQLTSDITINKPLTIPADFNRILEIEGHGNKIVVPAGLTFLFREYASLTAASAGIDCQVRIRNVIFTGTSTSSAINIQATYGTKIEGCRFYNFGTAIKTGWMMGTVIDQCYFWENNIDIDFDYARFTGGSNSESQSNHGVVRDSKFRHSAGQFAAIKATAVSGLQVNHNIFEGDAIGGQYEVFFDDGNSNVVKEVTITGNHVEQAPSVAGFYIKLKDGYATIDGVYSQYAHTLIKFESEAYSKLKVSNVPYLPTGTKFQFVGGGSRFAFENFPSTFDPSSATIWKDGVAPYGTRFDNWDSNGQVPLLLLNGRKL